MPVLIVLSIIISIYSITRPGALEGAKYFLVPDFSHFSWMTVVAAMGQMFYSLSIAMGILITFGSYMKRDVLIEESTKHVEIFDTAIAIMAGLMIIPAVFAFAGGNPETLQAGPSLMFITIPKVFASMGMGNFVGIGIYMVKNTQYDRIQVLSTIKGSPAEKIGIQAGDLIISVDGVEYKADDMTTASNNIKGEEGTKVII